MHNVNTSNVSVHVIYRSHGGENRKDRPGWYSKDGALTSFAVALLRAEQAGVMGEVLFLNDGDLPPERVRVMRQLGTIVPIHAGTNRRSYLAGLRLARDRFWPDGDLVLLAEDDYGWKPTALLELAQAAAAHPGAYLAPYGCLTGGPSPSHWEPHPSTTSTFAARLGELRQDHALLVVCALSGGDFDHTSCLSVQGLQRFSWADLVHHHGGAPEASSASRLARSAYLLVLRTAVKVGARRHRRHRRTLLAAVPALAAHLEVEQMGPGDWEGIAATTSTDLRHLRDGTT